MNVQKARSIAQEWVDQYGSRLPGFCGAYLSGSILAADGQDSLPETSDIDIVVIINQEPPKEKPGKFSYRRVLLEVTLIRAEEYASPEHVLSTHYLAYALHKDGILADPMGWLRPLHQSVKTQYANNNWVRRRCQSFLTRIKDCAARFDTDGPFHEQATQWVFPTGITTFPILAADLQNCTVRKRYTAARMVLESYGLTDFYTPLIRLLTGDKFRPDSLPGHLKELETTFDMASLTEGPSFHYSFRSDISQESRFIAIGGCSHLIASPYPMEAVFWMAATFARSHTILSMDAPDLHRKRLPSFAAFMADIGITGPEAFARRNQELLAFLPEVERVYNIIIQERTKVTVST